MRQIFHIVTPSLVYGSAFIIITNLEDDFRLSTEEKHQSFSHTVFHFDYLIKVVKMAYILSLHSFFFFCIKHILFCKFCKQKENVFQDTFVSKHLNLFYLCYTPLAIKVLFQEVSRVICTLSLGNTPRSARIL